MDVSVSFGAWLRQRRRALDLTQEELARRTGCSVPTIRKIETGERRPSRQIAALLADALDIPLAERPAFLQVARGERRVDRLAPPIQTTRLRDLATVRLLDYTTARPRDNLPTPPTPLIGRESELAEIARLLGDPQCRLLTLVGPGGIGKTRLAIAAAADQREAFADGVSFVSLASLSSPEFMIPAMADALGFAFYGATAPRVQLLNYLREKQALLILDNAEHLLAGAELLAELLQRTPGVKLLVTSRERLNLQGEWLFEIQGLPVPPADQVERVEDFSAAALFAQTARRVRAGFKLMAEERPWVAHICRMVDGMPLGIELAAAWVRVLSCREIAREVERNLDFLAASARDLPERHHSIRAAFDHSWNLLSTEEQRALRQLSVFRGGFRREAAEQIAGAKLSLLSALVDKSLLRHTDANAGRYDLHELIRQYAAARLTDDAQEQTATRERHAGYYAALLEQWEQPLKGAKHKETLEEIVKEINNVRSAWDWIAAHRQAVAIRQSTGTLWWFYELRGWFQEGLATFRRAAEALQAPDEPSEPEHTLAWGRALTYQGFFLHRLGQEARAREALLQGLALLRPLSDRAALADALTCLGWVALRTGDFVEARRHLHDSLALGRSIGYLWNSGVCLSTLGVIAYILGEYEEAQALLRESLAEWRVVGDPRNTAASLIFLGAAVHAQGDAGHAEAHGLLHEGLVISRAIGDRYTTGIGLNHLGVVAHTHGEHTEAQSLLLESIALLKEIGDRYSLAEALTRLGDVAVALEDDAEARRAYREGFASAVEAQAMPLALGVLVRIATLHAKEGSPEAALDFVLYVLNHPAGDKETHGRAERLRAELEEQLTPPQIEAALAQAQARTFETVVEEILAKSG